MAHVQVGTVVLTGQGLAPSQCCGTSVELEDQQELHDSRAQARSRLTTPAARMARIGMGQRRHPVRGCTCMLLTCDPSQGRGWCWEARRFEASEKGKAPAELMRANVRASERAAGSAAAEPQVASACD
jgi:hypothetical protein